ASTARPDTARFHYLLMEAIDYSLQHGVMAPDNYQADILTQIKQYLDDYYWREITLDDLGKMTHYSPGHLNAIFLRHFGQPIYTYLCQVRLRHAARLLQSGRMSIKNVAAAVGFQDQCYFSRYFRKHFGYPPSQAAGRMQG
ncbi:MAG TPA: helix-turn-helix transcriptional regulator, partial [Lentisphaeria bacterium]|nr:helix-turn-helix transcriptional regulator [Lentisphaeria bacterium]